MTNEKPKGCDARSADAGASRCRRAPDIDEGGRAAKTRRQEGGRRSYSRSDSGDGDSGGEGEPMGDDKSSGSVGIHDRAGGNGSNDDGDARDGSGARGAAAGAEATATAESESKVSIGAATAKVQTPVATTWAKPTTTRTMAALQAGRQTQRHPNRRGV